MIIKCIVLQHTSYKNKQEVNFFTFCKWMRIKRVKGAFLKGLNIKFYKMTTADSNHHGIQYLEEPGWVTDTGSHLSIHTYAEIKGEGLYFTCEEFISEWKTWPNFENTSHIKI